MSTTIKAEATEPLCMCKDRAASACPGEWEPGCDLGANEKHVRHVEPTAGAQVEAALKVGLTIEANNDEVICPRCCEQFRAIPVNVQAELSTLRADLADAKLDYGRACKTVAEMHAAAVGETGLGPRRGVVEDVADLRAERDALHKALAGALEAMELHGQQYPHMQKGYTLDAIDAARAALKGE